MHVAASFQSVLVKTSIKHAYNGRQIVISMTAYTMFKAQKKLSVVNWMSWGSELYSISTGTGLCLCSMWLDLLDYWHV